MSGTDVRDGLGVLPQIFYQTPPKHPKQTSSVSKKCVCYANMPYKCSFETVPSPSLSAKLLLSNPSLFLINLLFTFRERGRKEKEKERNIKMWEKHLIGCLVASCIPPNWGPGLKPRQVPWLGIELATFPSAGWYSIHCATPSRT